MGVGLRNADEHWGTVADVGLGPFPAGGLPDEGGLAPAYPNYVMVRRKFVRRILGHPLDANREAFIVQ